jgi:YD repeat-containing protein
VNTWITGETDQYTPTGKLHQQTDAENRTTSTDYDAADRVLTVTDPMTRQTHFVYCASSDANCAANQVKTELRAWGGANNNCTVAGTAQQCYRRVTYFADGEQKTVKDANGNTTSHAYDGFIRLKKTTFPDTTFEQLTLDENGNVTQRQNRASETLTYTYNDLDWLTQKCMPGTGASCPSSPAVTTSWAYLLNGAVDTLSDTAANSIDNSFDTAGRLTQVINHINGFGGNRTVNYTLDASGNRTQLTWPTFDGAYYVGYCYDNLNRMTAAMENSIDVNCTTNLLATYTYDTLSRRTNLAYGNGAGMAYSYSNAGDLLTLNHDMSGTANDPHYTFTYTNAHELLTEANTKSAYLWQPSTTATTTYAAANNLPQYPSSTGSLGTIPFAYDPKGNLAGYGLEGFTYDAENRLLTTVAPGLSAAYAYDPLGRRNHKSGTGVTETYFLDDGDDEIA